MKETRVLIKECLMHKPKRSVLKRFLIIVSVFLIYFLVTLKYYGLKDGFLVTALTWSLFVFCTPLADAGFLLDFPIRLLTKIRMIYSEISVWIIALILNLSVLFYDSSIYEKTFLLRLFKTILTTPIPYWSIIFLSVLGTFLSIYFGDELLDVINHKDREKYKKHKTKHLIIITLFVIVLIVILYTYLLTKLGVKF